LASLNAKIATTASGTNRKTKNAATYAAVAYREAADLGNDGIRSAS